MTRFAADQGRVGADVLLALAEGSSVITHGLTWTKTGPDEWRTVFREHVPDLSISPRWKGRFEWHDVKDSEWLAEVATRVIFDYAEWEREEAS